MVESSHSSMIKKLSQGLTAGHGAIFTFDSHAKPPGKGNGAISGTAAFYFDLKPTCWWNLLI